MRIDDFKLSAANAIGRKAAMIRGDQNYVLYGKISKNERKNAIGHYIGIRRKNNNNPAVAQIQYQLSHTGSKKYSQSHSFAKGDSYHEFKFLGKNYLNSSRMVAWKVSLLEGEVMLDSQHSYFWED